MGLMVDNLLKNDLGTTKGSLSSSIACNIACPRARNHLGTLGLQNIEFRKSVP
jgi:hypothetical protein